MSLPPEISKQNFEGLARAHAQNISGARQHDDKEKICKKFCCYDQKQQPPFFHICCFLLLFVIATKNVATMLLNNKGKFFV